MSEKIYLSNKAFLNKLISYLLQTRFNYSLSSLDKNELVALSEKLIKDEHSLTREEKEKLKNELDFLISQKDFLRDLTQFARKEQLENFYTKEEANEKFNTKANELLNEFKNNDLQALKEELKNNEVLLEKIQALETSLNSLSENFYTKEEANEKYFTKENTYSKEEADEKFSEKETSYLKDETYNKEEIENKIKTKTQETASEILKSVNVNFDPNEVQMGIEISLHSLISNNTPAQNIISPFLDAKGASRDQILKEFLGVYPVVLQADGSEYKKLDPNDYEKFEDGSDARNYITSPGYNVMIAQPLRGIKLQRINDTTAQLIFTTSLNKEGFSYKAFQHAARTPRKIYIGAYEASEFAGKLYSLSNQNVKVNTTLTQFVRMARATYVNYGNFLISFHQRSYLQACFLLTYQDIDSQRVIGKGLVSMSGASKTGLSNKYGLHSEIIKQTNPSFMTDGKHAVKALGYENLWGNVWENCQGFLLQNGQIFTSTCAAGTYDPNFMHYTYKGQALNQNIGGQNIANVAWDNDLFFYPTRIAGQVGVNGFRDAFWQSLNVNAGYISGGAWTDNTRAGIFETATNANIERIGNSIGTRIVRMF